MMAAVGCAVDYSNASMIRTKLQAAADAATLATVSFNSPVVTTTKNMTGNGTVAGGSAYGTNIFTANLPASYSSVTPTVTVTKTGTTVTATVSFSTSVPTYFMGIMGYPTITIADSSTASYTLPTYIDFYLMLDVSGSMSFPSTAAEQARLQAVNPDNYGRVPHRLHVRLSFYRAGCLRPVKPRTDPRRRSQLRGLHTEPKPGRILPRVYHFALGDHARVL